MTQYNKDNYSIEWYTPEWVLKNLGDFDLDPCHPKERIAWQNPTIAYDKEDDGLSKEWFGRVWLNPPYGSEMYAWLKKMGKHGSGIALVPPRTGTGDWQDNVLPYFKSMLFLRGRIQFVDKSGNKIKNKDGKNSGNNSDSVLIAYSDYDTKILENCGLKGFIIYENTNSM